MDLVESYPLLVRCRRSRYCSLRYSQSRSQSPCRRACSKNRNSRLHLYLYRAQKKSCKKQKIQYLKIACQEAEYERGSQQKLNSPTILL